MKKMKIKTLFFCKMNIAEFEFEFGDERNLNNIWEKLENSRKLNSNERKRLVYVATLKMKFT